MTDFVLQSAQVGSIPAIPNDLADGGLNTAILVDPVKIRAYKSAIADQMNAQSAGPKFTDLSDRIGNVRIEDSAQGAGIVVVPITDPLWVLLMSGFIQTDENGYLWPPIDINFPAGTDCWWRLCQVRAVWDADVTEENVTLTFEDRIASLLREMSGAVHGALKQGQPNQTLGGFIKMLVDNANQVLGLKGTDRIRLVELIDPQDPNYTVPINNLPASAQAPLGKQPIRKDPLKQDPGLTAQQQTQLDQIQTSVSKLFGITPGGLAGPAGGPLTLREIEQGSTALLHGSGSETTVGFGPVGNPIIRPAGVP